MIKFSGFQTKHKVTRNDKEFTEFYTIFSRKSENVSLTQFYKGQEDWLCTQFII